MKTMTFVLFLAFVLSACAPAPARTATPPARPTSIPLATPADPLIRVRAFQEAFNERDTEGFLAFFGDNAAWNLAFSASGKQAIRNIAEFWFQLNSTIELSDCKLEGSSVSCKWTYKDHCLPPEIDAYHYDVTFEFKEGKISSLVGQLTNLTADAAFTKYQSQMLSWASQNLPEDFAKHSDAEWAKFSGTGDQGSGKLSATEFGQVWDRICTGYAKATK